MARRLRRNAASSRAPQPARARPAPRPPSHRPRSGPRPQPTPRRRAALNNPPPPPPRSVVKFYESKQYKKAVKAADAILKKFPDHGETLAMKGLTLKCAGRPPGLTAFCPAPDPFSNPCS
jgi:hypothetical protein